MGKRILTRGPIKICTSCQSPNTQSCMILGVERGGQQKHRPRNHSSLRDHLPQVRQHIRQGQRDGRYLVVHVGLLDHWQDVYISPIGVVGKGVTDIRLIDDYSFPEGESVNGFADRSNRPLIYYNPPGDIARRIDMLRHNNPHARILMMLGDVAGAFRHVPIHAEHTHVCLHLWRLFGHQYGLRFRVVGSPAYYHLAGTLINGLNEQTRVGHGDHIQSTQCAHWSELGASGGDAPSTTPVSGTLTGLFWCDDHTCVELDEGTRCCQANVALRRTIPTVLWPSAINERKFTQWGEQGKSLGQLWDTCNGTVTVPAEKIAKAHQRVQALLVSDRATKTRLLQVVGSLRHVASCCPPARAFFRRIQSTASSARRYGRFTLSRAVLEDLKRFRYVLRH
ncbi:LOW QUALITY PROTEIN: Hypothetical protein PHPALM_19620 [Phytophthora palmivora]|uniref:Uncharacterized protein n=1 Tax=Phytophthora palmivora TaxID=4796 RepID=A0A2P4XGZ3_9STRA|nr:LOW QUALITY PROTEIN: Hypothetical protein PHPALM_19620 [Phytophthora palmivora]